MDRYSSQSSNSLQSINSILSDEANTSMLTYSSVAAAPKSAKNDTIHAVEDNGNNVVPKVRIEHAEEIQAIEKEGGIESASQSLTDILDSVRPPKMRPPSAHRELLGTRYQGSQESLAESIDRSMATTPDLTGSMTKLPGGRGLQKHIDMSRIDLERQQKVIYISDHVYFLIDYFRTVKHWQKVYEYNIYASAGKESQNIGILDDSRPGSSEISSIVPNVG